MKFMFGLTEIEFTEGASYPANRPIEKMQIVDRTAGGQLQVEELGITLKRRILNFELMSKYDYELLENWFDNVVNGAEHPFEFEDERGFTGTVKFITTKLDFPEIDFELYSGSVELEYQL